MITFVLFHFELSKYTWRVRTVRQMKDIEESLMQTRIFEKVFGISIIETELHVKGHFLWFGKLGLMFLRSVDRNKGVKI